MAGTRSSKRRSPDKSPHEPVCKKSKHASESTVLSEQKSSRLLELPIELFDMILGYIAADAGAFLSNKSTSLRSPSALISVSRHVRDEYQRVLNVSASEIRTEVRDFDFSHIVSFFNRLSERELNTLPTISLPKQRKFIITLFPTQSANPEQLHRWLLRLESTTKKGTKIAADYTVPLKSGKMKTHGLMTPILFQSYDGRWPILRTFDKWLLNLDQGRLRDEVSKIKNAISPPRH